MSGRSIDDMGKVLTRFETALGSPQTMGFLTKTFGVDRRTIYRWMESLEGEVHRIGTKRPTQYTYQKK